MFSVFSRESGNSVHIRETSNYFLKSLIIFFKLLLKRQVINPLDVPSLFLIVSGKIRVHCDLLK